MNLPANVGLGVNSHEGKSRYLFKSSRTSKNFNHNNEKTCPLTHEFAEITGKTKKGVITVALCKRLN